MRRATLGIASTIPGIASTIPINRRPGLLLSVLFHAPFSVLPPGTCWNHGVETMTQLP